MAPTPVEQLVETPLGPARITMQAAEEPRLTLLLMHGANGSIKARDLVALATRLPGDGVTTMLLEQPFAVAGKKVAPRPPVLDDGLRAVIDTLSVEGPLVLGGRSSGARVAVRCAREAGAVGALCLAFPLHPPGKPEASRADELLGSGVPTLVLQGTRDTFGGPEEFPDLPETTRLVPVQSADHGFRVPKAAPLGESGTVDRIVETSRRWLSDLSGPGI